MAIYGTQEVINSRKSKQCFDFKNRVITTRGISIDFDISPHVPMENMIDNSAETHILTTTNDTICQVFKASSDNIHDIHLTLQGTGIQDSLDDFEGYVDTTALRVEWVASDTVNTFVTLDTTTVHGGTQSMAVQCRKNQSAGDKITKDYGIGGVDWSGYENLNFWIYNDVDLSCIWKINIIDTSSNIAELQFNQPSNQWFEQSLSFFDFSNFATMDWENIRYIEFEMVSCTSALHTFYIDDMELHGPAGNVDIELVDFGGTAPISGDDFSVAGSLLDQDNGVSDLTISLGLTKKMTPYHLHYGSHDYDKSLTVGNYYGIHIKNPSSGQCIVHGSSTKKYNSGGCFTINGSDVMADTDKTMYFIVYCIQPALLTKIEVETDANAGASEMFIHTEDRVTDKLQDDIIRHIFNDDKGFSTEFIQTDAQLFYTDRRYQPECHFNDASDSSAESFSIHTYYMYQPVEENG